MELIKTLYISSTMQIKNMLVTRIVSFWPECKDIASIDLKFENAAVLKNYEGWLGAIKLIKFFTSKLFIQKLFFIDQPQENVE